MAKIRNVELNCNLQSFSFERQTYSVNKYGKYEYIILLNSVFSPVYKIVLKLNPETMSYVNWLLYLNSAEKIQFIGGGLRQVLYKFPDRQQLAEEYHMDTNWVLRRVWLKLKDPLAEPECHVEVGLFIQTFIFNGGWDPEICLTNREVHVIKRITGQKIEWYFLNLPNPFDVYAATAVPGKCALMIRTTNNKYHSMIPMPDLERCGLLPEQKNIFTFQEFNQLIVYYRKPELLCEMETQVMNFLSCGTINGI